MKIIIINDFASANGGAGFVALSSARGMAERGHSVSVFSAVGPIPQDPIPKNLNFICTNQHEILKDPNRLRATLQGVWNFKSSRLFEDLLKQCNPNNTIIHVHSWTKALSSSVIRKAINSGFKIVFTLHDYFLACPNGGFFNFPKNQICHLKPLSVACLLSNCDARNYPQKLWRFGRQWIQKKIGLVPQGIHHFITVSNFSRSILLPFLPSNATLHHLNNPIDVSQNPPGNIIENKGFIFVGRLSKEKGAHIFAKAASILNCEATFVGEGDNSKKILEIYPSSRITGWLAKEEVYTHMRAARALIFPSLCYETQGLVVLEAAAMGIPSIVPDTSAAKDLVENEVTGLWFKGGDFEDLVDKIQMLKSNALTKKMGAQAYHRYWAKPASLDHHLRQLEKIYLEILSSSN